MAIKAENKVFSLETANTLYQMKVDEFGVLNYLWYGAKTDCCMDYLLDYPDVGFSGNIYEAEDNRSYSLNTRPLEYGAEGVGDFRVPAISVTHADGSTALDLRFQNYEIKLGMDSFSWQTQYGTSGRESSSYSWYSGKQQYQRQFQSSAESHSPFMRKRMYGDNRSLYGNGFDVQWKFPDTGTVG